MNKCARGEGCVGSAEPSRQLDRTWYKASAWASFMSRYLRRQLTFWSVHLVLLIGVVGWAVAFEPSTVNLVAVGICLALPSLTATALYRQLILGRLWLALWRPAAAAAA